VQGLVDKTLYHFHPKLCTVWIGFIPTIIIQDYQLAKDICSRDEFSGRFVNWRHHGTTDGHPLGLLFSQGKYWKEQRRFAIKHLKGFGFGRAKLDIIIQDEASHLIEGLLSKSYVGDVLFDGTFDTAVINALWQIVASKRYDPDIPESQVALQKVEKIFTTKPGIISLLISVPFLKPILPYTAQEIALIELKQLFREHINQRLEQINDDLDSGDDFIGMDFIDVYLQANKLATEDLEGVLLDLFLAGIETTSTTLLWTIMLLALYPKIQEKCQEEIEDILGENLPEKNDASRLVYCAATVQEVQRFSSAIPVAIPHTATKDLVLEGYSIKKDNRIIINLQKIMKDHRVFKNPDEFNPERFIENDLKTGERKLKSISHFIPFGIGKRSCPGESFAKGQMFIFIVMILQRLKLSKPMNHSVPSIHNYRGEFTNMPSPFYVSITKR